jgi:hypothetical protein
MIVTLFLYFLLINKEGSVHNNAFSNYLQLKSYQILNTISLERAYTHHLSSFIYQNHPKDFYFGHPSKISLKENTFGTGVK